MKEGIIYKAENKINGKCYVGQTRNSLNSRKHQHKFKSKNNSNSIFHKEIKKYGMNNFEWSILCECNIEELNEKEVSYMLELNTLYPYGYNMMIDKHGYNGLNLKGKNNPRYGDHRTWEEIHGKEKANEMKRRLKATFTDERKAEIAEQSRKRFIENNPMSNPEYRKKLSEIRMGGKNPIAIYEWKFILPDGTIYKTDCLREFCRNTGFKRYILTHIANKDNYKPRDKKYQGWKCVKTLKEK